MRSTRNSKFTSYSTFVIALGLVLSLTAQLCHADDVTGFTLANERGETVAVNFKDDSSLIVLEWTNPGCPFVKKFYDREFMQMLQKEYVNRGVEWITINSTHAEHPDFIRPEDRVSEKVQKNIQSSHFLFDPEGTVGQQFGAKTTPHMFVIKGKGLVYQGAIDDAADTDSDPSVAKNYVKHTLDAVIAGESVELSRTRPYGCSVKY